MALSDRQQAFSRKIARLMLVAEEMGYQITVGDFFRDPRAHGVYGTKLGYSAANSQHKRRLAADLNLFRNGEYLTGVEAENTHRDLHRVWSLMGGDPAIPGDANHYQYTDSN